MTRVTALLFVVACQSPSVLDKLASTRDAAHPPEVPAPTELDALAIDAWVGAEVAKQQLVGVSLVIVHRGETVLARGYGVAELGSDREVSADTPFAIGSVSKQFACAIAYSLADEGKLAMSDTVAKYEPALPRAADITLADLGGHTSGYRDYYPLDYTDSRLLAAIDPDALVAQHAKLGVDFEPGTRYSYSNTGFVLLARIAERASGKSYAQLLDERIAKPLGLGVSATRPANAAVGYTSFLLGPPEPAKLETAGWLLGAGEIYASANDIAKWSVAFADGKVLSSASRQAMATARTLRDGRTTSYGCGLGTRVINGETVLGHTGAVSGFLTRASFVPRTRSSVVIISNDERADLASVQDRLVRLVTFDTSAIPKIPAPPTVDVVRELIVQLQTGSIDRSKLGDDLSWYLDDARVAAARERLQALGEPRRLTLLGRSERGALEVSQIRIDFENKTIDGRVGGASIEATVFRSPDGKLRQLLLSR